jgi:hypothetical protein
MSAKFNPAKPHHHHCKCGKSFYCAAKNCEYPKYITCKGCNEGWIVAYKGGRLIEFQNRPATISQMDFGDSE